MSHDAFSQARSRRRSGNPVSLFPFMAVLVCAMGVMLVLLVVLIRQVRFQAVQAAEARTIETQNDLAAARDVVRWRVSEMVTSRKKTEEDLAQARLRLGHVEDHARQLRTQLVQLESAWKELQTSDLASGNSQKNLETERTRIEQEIAQAQHELTNARRGAAGRRGSYAVVPYEGPNHTRRRPIYLECRADCVVLQPEGLVLVEADFEGPLGPGNPLDSALRAVREYLMATKQIAADGSEEPYPLLLVRPDGIAAYYAVRGAMKSWSSDFGYELIGADWKLDFPVTTNAELAKNLKSIVARARAEQRQVAELVRQTAPRKSRAVYRAAPGGGLVRESGSGEDPADDSSGDQEGAFGTRLAPSGGAGGSGSGLAGTGGSSGGLGTGSGSGGYASGSGGSGIGGGGLATNGSGNGQGGSGIGSPGGNGIPGGGTAPGSASGNGTAGSGASAGGTSGTSLGSGMGNAVFGNNTGGSNGYAQGTSSGAVGSPYAASDGAEASRSKRTKTPEGYVIPSEEIQAENATAAAERARYQDVGDRGGRGERISGQGMALRPGEWVPNDPPDRDRRPPEPERDRTTKPRRLSETRGHDWGLPDATHGASAITRPIRVVLYPDRLILMPESGAAGTQAIVLGPRTQDSVDALISAVWEHMKSWGIAGRGMYWRPILRAAVAPGAQNRYAELKILLDGSGLAVQRIEE